MVNAVNPATVASANQCAANRPDPAAMAQRIIAENGGASRPNLSEIKRQLDAVRAQDAELGAALEQQLNAQLGPVKAGELARAAYSVRAADGQGITFQAGAPSVSDYRAMPAQSAGRDFYNRLDRLWGDGQYATDDSARIQAGLRDLQASGLSLADYEAQRAAAPAPTNDNGPSGAKLGLDLTQIGLDIVGIFEPTPFADGSNAVISGGRAIYEATQGNWWEAGGHVLGGLASAAGILPYLGDTAKLAKLPGYARTVSNAVELAARNPEAARALEPGLREIHRALNNISPSTIDSLPSGAADAIRGMKSQLDSLFGAGARQADDAGGAVVRHADELGDAAARSKTGGADDFARPAMVDGRPQLYFDTPGRKGAWNKDLNARLAANSDYHVNGYKYSTDARGRVTSVEGQLTLQKAERNGYQQAKAGGAGR